MFSPEQFDRQLIQNEFQAWEKIIREKGFYDEVMETQDYNFSINRNNNPQSFFTAEVVNTYLLPRGEKLEEWTDVDPKKIEPTVKGEEWLKIEIEPDDIYRPSLGYFKEGSNTFYITSGLYIYISCLGRGYQSRVYAGVDVSDPMRLSKNLAELKKRPNIDTITYFKTDPTGSDYSLLSDSINSQTYERLRFLRSLVLTGGVTKLD